MVKLWSLPRNASTGFVQSESALDGPDFFRDSCYVWLVTASDSGSSWNCMAYSTYVDMYVYCLRDSRPFFILVLVFPGGTRNFLYRGTSQPVSPWCCKMMQSIRDRYRRPALRVGSFRICTRRDETKRNRTMSFVVIACRGIFHMEIATGLISTPTHFQGCMCWMMVWRRQNTPSGGGWWWCGVTVSNSGTCKDTS